MSGKSKVLENSVLYTFSELLVKAIGFFLLPFYTRFLTPEDYGITNLLNGFTQVAIFIVSFSLYSAIIRFYADYKEDREKLKRFYGTVIMFILTFSVIMVSLALIVSNVLFSKFFKGISFYPIIFITLLTLTFVSLHTVHQNIMQGMQLGKKLTMVNLTVFGLQVSLNLFFIGVIKLGAFGVLLSSLIINICYSFFMVVDLKKNDLITFCIDKDMLKESLSYSIPLMPHNLSTNIASFASRVFINSSGTLSSVGLYGVSSQFGAIIDTVQSSVNHAFAPWFYESMNNCNKETKQDIVKLSHFLIILYSLLYMLIGLFSQEVIILMTNKRYIMAWTAVPILAIAYSIKSIYYFYINILFYYKEASRKLFIASFAGSFADIIISYFMVPLYGMYGAAISFLIAKVIVVAIVVFISRNYNDIGYHVIEMLKIIIPNMLFMGIGLYFSYTKYITEFNLSNFAFKLMVLFEYLIYLYLTNRKLIIRILKSGIIKNMLNKRNKKEIKRAMNDTEKKYNHNILRIRIIIIKVIKCLKSKNWSESIIGWCLVIYMLLINKTCNVKKNKVVFKSFGGKSYSDNPKAVSEKLKMLYPEFKIVWLFNNPKEKKKLVPYYVKCVKARSLRALRELATAKVWVDNFNKSSYLYKSKEQIYIQTWHGDRGFKKILHDSPFVPPSYKLFESKNCNLMVSGSDYADQKYNTAFKYYGDILKQGCPRNDLLVKNSETNKYFIKKDLNILNNSKILLYAPTLRRENSNESKLQSSQNIDLIAVIKALEMITNNKWICLVRAHNAVKGLSGVPNIPKKIIDCSSYEDMAELLLISDFLITDYSSCAGDFVLLKRPVILYQPDRLEYIQKDRTFYFELDSSPYIIAKSNYELISMIYNLNWKSIPKNCRDILKFYGALETGEASKKVAEYIKSQSK